MSLLFDTVQAIKALPAPEIHPVQPNHTVVTPRLLFPKELKEHLWFCLPSRSYDITSPLYGLSQFVNCERPVSILYVLEATKPICDLLAVQMKKERNLSNRDTINRTKEIYRLLISYLRKSVASTAVE